MTLAVVPTDSLVLDYSFAEQSIIQDFHNVRRAGFVGIARYLSGTPSKDIDRIEVEKAGDANLGICLVYETNGRPDLRSYWGGREDCNRAWDQAEEIDAPPGTLIYYTGDKNFITWSTSQAYAEGWHEVAIERNLKYVTGAYGPESMIVGAYNAGIASHCWQPETWMPSWTFHPAITMKQMVNSRKTTYGGLSVDENQTLRPFNMWFPGGYEMQESRIIAVPSTPVTVNQLHSLGEDQMFRCLTDDNNNMWIVRDGRRLLIEEMIKEVEAAGAVIAASSDGKVNQFLRDLKAAGLLVDNFWTRVSWSALLSIPAE